MAMRHASGALTYTSFIVEEVKLRIYKDAVIAIGREAAQGSYKGQSIPGNFRITLIFVEQHDAWLIAGQHLSPISEPVISLQSGEWGKKSVNAASYIKGQTILYEETKDNL